MKKIMIAAMRSGSGKTVFSCGLMMALKKLGLSVQACKCGPDYIDPMFHGKTLGIPSRNLDLFLQGREGLRRTLRNCVADVVVTEAAMGYYDGIAETERCSAWEIARETDMPALLVLRPGGESITLAAQVRGMLDFRGESMIRGLVLTDCREGLFRLLRGSLERETGLPVLGYLPPMEQAVLPERHLGLLTPDEIDGIRERFSSIADQISQTVDLNAILALAADMPDAGRREPKSETSTCRIAVARDEAFCFLYEDSLDSLRSAGAELCFFSPLHDTALPGNTDGLYLPGGYPELHAEELAQNEAMRRAIRETVRSGLPTVAECGGFLYLQESMENEQGRSHPMCGVLGGRGYRTERLQRFGYVNLIAEQDSLLFRQGETIPAHEFHYWDCTENGTALLAVKADGRNWRCGFADENLYAAFPHLHLGGELPLAERFVETCAERRKRAETQKIEAGRKT